MKIAVETIDCNEKEMTLKKQFFREVFNCSNRADREKNKSNYRFPSIVQNNGKEGLTLSKVRRKKSLAKVFRKDLTKIIGELNWISHNVSFCSFL